MKPKFKAGDQVATTTPILESFDDGTVGVCAPAGADLTILHVYPPSKKLKRYLPLYAVVDAGDGKYEFFVGESEIQSKGVVNECKNAS